MTAIRCLCGGGALAAVDATDGENARTFTYHCGTCHRDIALQLILRDLGVRPDPRCGTEAGYQAHRWRGGTKCDPCLAAHVAAVNQYRVKRRQVAS